MIQTTFKSPLLKQLALRLANRPISPTWHQYAVLVAITNETYPKILYTLRSGQLNHHSGEVSFAGGRREATDVDNHATALRETWEETGILPSDVTILGELALHHTQQGIPVLPVVGIIPPDLVLTPHVGEVERLFWADLRGLLVQDLVSFSKQYHQFNVTTSAFIIDNETVWGLTARITASLLEVGFDRKIVIDFSVV
ncbi:MutT/nudix family protein [Moraxella macacae 0408225]|uniref:MutT/nudix family protein n=1 Tax=Moraxella macacae 0408225 TaxID=1230338 RepID=L2F7S9_9GAMM|nr:CoA pyrophosphatase [Moraxella macacae]ELA08970.1 MutT/nudix family protein [Moraxella macacae 0408225]